MTEPALEEVVEITDHAAAVILEHYARPSVAQFDKQDGSPVTEADQAANAVLIAALSAGWPYPVLSEETPFPPYEERRRWHRFWLLDPLDGTRDFIARTGEFGVNVALIEDGKPILGVIVAPVLGVTWMAARGQGAYKREGGRVQVIDCKHRQGPIVGLKSRFYSTPAVDAYFAAHQVSDVHVIGSTIKICRIAEGAADVYMSPGKSKEWDMAPGQLIVEEAGGRLLELSSLTPLKYGRADVENPALVVCSARFQP